MENIGRRSGIVREMYGKTIVKENTVQWPGVGGGVVVVVSACGAAASL